MNKKVYLIIGFVAALLILFTIIQISKQNSFTYQGRNSEFLFTIEQVGDIIAYRPHVFFGKDEYVYAFRNKPQDLENIPIETDLRPILQRSTITTVYITRDLNLSALTDDRVSIAIAPLEDILSNKKPTSPYQFTLRRVFTESSTEHPQTPVTCSTANSGIVKQKYLVIYLRLAEQNRILT